MTLAFNTFILTFNEGDTPMEKKQYAGAYVREIREGQKISLRQFALKIGKTPTFVSRFERGDEHMSPSAETLKVIADVLGIDADDLIFRANKVPADLPKIMQSHAGMAALLRTAQNLTQEELQALTEQARKKVDHED